MSQAEYATEQSIVLAMLASTDFLKRIIDVVDKDYFIVDDVRTVVSWIQDYYSVYGKAPEKDAEALFEDKMRRMGREEKKSFEILFNNLDEYYINKGFNVDYLADRTIKYFGVRKLRDTMSTIDSYLKEERLEEAQELLHKCQVLPQVVDTGIEPFTDEAISLYFKRQRERTKFTFGIESLDKIAGPMLSNWFVMFMAPMKHGKTMALTYCAIRAARMKMDVVYYSLESGVDDLLKRMYMAEGALVETRGGKVEIPFYTDSDKDVVTSEIRTRPETVRSEIRSRKENWKKMGYGRLLMKSYPSYSASINDIDRHLDYISTYNAMHPKVILVDYVGILRAPKEYQGRDRYDYNTQMLKGLAEKYNAIVISATQGTRKTLEKMTMVASDVPEDIRQIANVDVLFGLNQKEWEKRQHIMRINCIVHRFREVFPTRQCEILQQPKAGQFHLDNKFHEEVKKDYDETQGGTKSKVRKEGENGSNRKD